MAEQSAISWTDGTFNPVIGCTRISPVCDHCYAARDNECRKSDLVDVSAEVKGETDKAWRLFDGAKTEWVPKSQVEDNGDGTFAMPEWLAKDKGFI